MGLVEQILMLNNSLAIQIQGVQKTFVQTSPDDGLNKDEQCLFQPKPPITYRFRDNQLWK